MGTTRARQLRRRRGVALVLSTLLLLTEAIGPTPLGATNVPATPPPGGHLVEGEDLLGGTALPGPGAHGGEFLRSAGASGPAGVPAGTYLLTTRVRAVTPRRIDVVVDGDMVGSYPVSGSWVLRKAVLRLSGPASTVGVVPAPAQSADAGIDIDWIHLASIAAIPTVQGNRIVGADGSTFVPRGVNRPGYHLPSLTGGRFNLPARQTDDFFIWGVTTVRLPLNQELWLANCPSRVIGPTTVATKYRRAVLQDVAELTSRGIVVILELAVAERGRKTGCAPPTTPYLKEMADARSVLFWRDVATRFKNHPGVVFDLFNEPHDIPDEVWRNGGTVTYQTGNMFTPTASYRAVGMQRLYNVVRATGAHNLLLVSGQRWSTDPRVALTHPLDGYGIVLAPHTYCEQICAGQPDLNPMLDTFVSPEVLARHPVVIAETGFSNGGTSAFSRKIIDWASARGAGWALFAWNNPDVDPEFNLLKRWERIHDAGGGAVTKPPSPAGAPVWNSLADVRTSRGYAANRVPEIL